MKGAGKQQEGVGRLLGLMVVGVTQLGMMKMILGWEGVVKRQAEAEKLEGLGVGEGRTSGWVMEEMTAGVVVEWRAQGKSGWLW